MRNGKPESWPAYNVERREIGALRSYKGNARTHSEEQVAQLAASIREWGWTAPILIDAKDGVIAGHGRLMAAQSLGIEEVPVIVARGWTAAQKRAYALADNQLPQNAGWDMDLLRIEIGALGDAGFDASLLGFDEAFLSGLLRSTVGLTDPDEAPSLPDAPTTRPGDVWTLGRHRLLCGDATEADDVAKALNGVLPNLMVTDPPYGVNYDADWRNHCGIDREGAVQRISSGKVVKRLVTMAIGKVQNDDRADWREAWALFPGDVAYVWHGANHVSEVQESLVAVGLDVRTHLIWSKSHFVISRGDYHYRHESCWYAVRKGKAGQWAGDRKQTSVWEIEHRKSDTGHSTQKPVECMKRPIENNSNPGQAIYDPFVGAGTCIIAAEMTGRACYALEINPGYCDVTVKRWENFTGEKATRNGSYAEAAE